MASIMVKQKMKMGPQKIWMEETKSLGLKKDLVNKYDLAGIAC